MVLSRLVLFLHTAHPDERIFLLKDYETLQQMVPYSHDIQSHNKLTEYQREPKYHESYCLADDFESQQQITLQL